MLSKRQSQILVKQINATTTRSRRKFVYQFVIGKCPTVLGFSTFAACVNKLFKFDVSTFYRMAASAQVELKLTGQIGVLPDNTLRFLAKLPAKKRRLIWHEVQKRAKHNYRFPTCKKIKKLVEDNNHFDEFFD